MQRQAELEQAARERGIERQRSIIARALEQERASETVAGLDMVRRSIEPAASAIAEYMVDTEVSGRGRRPALFRLCGHCDPYLLAFLTGKVAIDRAAHNTPLLRTVLSIGAAIEDEFRHAAFEAREPALYRTIKRSLEKRSASPEHARVVWSTSAVKANIDIPRWSRNELVQIGVTLFDLFADATDMVARELVPLARDKVQWKAVLTPRSSEWFADRNEKAGLLRPAYLPTVIPPRPWSSLRGGGYHTDALFDLPFIKRTRPEHMEELKRASLPVVYQGLNAIQSTAWRVNAPVLDTLRHAWDHSIPIQCLPKREELEIPPKPFDIATNADALRNWKAEARDTHLANVQSRGTRFEFARLLTTAGELANDPAIYFPHQLDFRGRAYAVPPGLNPQGPDEAKALLTLSQGKVLGVRGLYWLGVHGANTFGLDKVSFDERNQWAHDNRGRIIATAARPFNDLWWTEADKPWSFLAWCFEWAACDGPGSVSSLPISLDGSCNGLQHFSAMLRDPIGGAAVNLIPSDQPQDIYGRVADRTIEKLREPSDDFDTKFFASGWLAFGIDRKITKRPVMVLPYGGTRMAALRYVRDAVREKIRDGAENPFGDQLARAEVYLSGVVWQAIGDVVVAARSAMDWLQQVARVAASVNQGLTWETPSGFIAHQSYLDTKLRRIRTKSRGEFIKMRDYLDGNKIDSARQSLAISPNFVHSMDAASMMLTIRDAQSLGVSQFAMIHDSYGTAAADVEALASALRSAFVTMYDSHDVLAEFLAGVSARLPEKVRPYLPPIPPRGTLDIHAVKNSAYFFA